MVQTDALVKMLRERGHRVTAQRRLVLEILEESQEHLDAECVYARAKERDHIGLATVYRSLALLKDLGLVEEHSLGENHGHFETIQNDPHYHFTCLRCEKVVEFNVPEIETVIQALCERDQFEVSSVDLYLRGLCRDCRSKPS